ncbi:NADH-quinone oxidoreductase subunit C [Sulfurimonas autotrophica]|uniref:NADH-quinone oxidoreductase n=1 Tax=Sulfurimonas autotrophica (strain ATCC BAA-671 / DSM 16294 / JCM 11897 / OK10) TaxID=563040 RepID=E0UQK5_SULAO|nr:NADH-quinone oxidoreductase subunit C [Sulfurimonas autotrophica]ADN09877.1 NADH dehydrogenase subunit C [Sulfurimonas autotrophica DSM 16294]
MRAYKAKDDVQAKAYYTDRFYVAPQVPKTSVEEDAVFSSDLAAIKAKFEVKDAYIQVEQMVVYINAHDIYGVLELMRDELAYTQLSEMSAIDWLAKDNTFEIFYQMLSMTKRKRIRIKYFIENGQAVDSVEKLFRSADWAEREMFDMFGIEANNHPFMKRILMPYDWEGFPLLKTYPLEGDEFAAWYEVDKIYGKEARDIIGPELRDTARVDRYDSERFARLGHEVPKGTKITGDEPAVTQSYQEEGGVFMVTKLDKESSKVIDDPQR